MLKPFLNSRQKRVNGDVRGYNMAEEESGQTTPSDEEITPQQIE